MRPVIHAVVLAAALSLSGGCQKIPFRAALDDLVNPPPAWHKAADSTAWGARTGMQAAVLGNAMYVIGGVTLGTPALLDAFSSTDGVSWSSLTVSSPPAERYRAAMCTFNAKIWVIGGLKYDDSVPYANVYATTDGSTLAALPPAALPTLKCSCSATEFLGKLWVMGGLTNTGDPLSLAEVHSTVDGSSWLAQAAPAWGSRFAHGAVVFNGELWVLGGEWMAATYTSFVLKDVWHSPDGTTWTRGVDAAWSARAGHCTAVYDGKIWVIGGCDGVAAYSNEVWTSTDGAAWTKMTVPTDFPARAYGACVVFNNRLYVMGGRKDQLTGLLCDVWYYGN
jgi:N-acetylneuraminic acid mutarotase